MRNPNWLTWARVTILAAVAVRSAPADLVTLSLSGTYDSTVTPNTVLLAPSVPWSLSITVDSQPNTPFIQDILGSTYLLDGTTIPVPVIDILSGTAAQPSLSVDFADFDGSYYFALNSPFYSEGGLIPGVYPISSSSVQTYHNELLGPSQILTNSLVISPVAVPEPEGLGLSGLALGLLMAIWYAARLPQRRDRDLGQRNEKSRRA